MDIDEEFAALNLPKNKKGLAWEGRARIMWGLPPAEVQAELVAQGVDEPTAEQIVAIAVRERALNVRAKGVRDLVIGIPLSVAAAGLGFGAVLVVQLFGGEIRGLALIVTACFLALAFGVHLTWRGLVRTAGGSKVKGAVSDGFME